MPLNVNYLCLLFSIIMTSAAEQLLKSNVQWATAVTQKDLGFFPKSAQGQSPQVRTDIW